MRRYPASLLFVTVFMHKESFSVWIYLAKEVQFQPESILDKNLILLNVYYFMICDIMLVVIHCTLFASFAILATQAKATAKPGTNASASNANNDLKFIRIHLSILPASSDNSNSPHRDSVTTGLGTPEKSSGSGINRKDDKHNNTAKFIRIHFGRPFDLRKNDSSANQNSGGNKNDNRAHPSIPVTESSIRSGNILSRNHTVAKPVRYYMGLPFYDYSKQKNAPKHLTQL
ncbi:unnamed protein product [Gongylonema pulchrum]|uniref:Neur_chan_memb domain-containing protein n=1 Tax=Gongylonema pulchrum TaxID=637853 RepID=A0A183D133_9BILA|nr:unnamed protein product [Gongylonema pulchrum]